MYCRIIKTGNGETTEPVPLPVMTAVKTREFVNPLSKMSTEVGVALGGAAFLLIISFWLTMWFMLAFVGYTALAGFAYQKNPGTKIVKSSRQTTTFECRCDDTQFKYGRLNDRALVCANEKISDTRKEWEDLTDDRKLATMNMMESLYDLGHTYDKLAKINDQDDRLQDISDEIVAASKEITRASNMQITEKRNMELAALDVPTIGNQIEDVREFNDSRLQAIKELAAGTNAKQIEAAEEKVEKLKKPTVKELKNRVLHGDIV